jgi:hypothetical protein
MNKIEGIFYGFRNKENIDLSKTDIIRFNISETQYIDVQLKDGIMDIQGSDAIKITLNGGCNCINVSMKE